MRASYGRKKENNQAWPGLGARRRELTFPRTDARGSSLEARSREWLIAMHQVEPVSPIDRAAAKRGKEIDLGDPRLSARDAQHFPKP